MLPGQGMVLSYVLRVEPFTRLARLYLFLADSREGLAGQPDRYAVQRHHLERPPNFLNADDVALLQALVDADENWLGQSEGFFPAPGDALLSKILQTGRCFLHYREKEYLALVRGESRKLNLAWRIEQDASQTLAWQPPEKCEGVVLTADPLAAPWILNSANRQLCPPAHIYSNSDLASAYEAPARLTPDQVENFLEQNHTVWQQQNLPLPQIIPTKKIETEVVPVLICETNNVGKKATDFINLVFHYATEDVCLLAIENEPPRYWDGQQLYVGSINTERQKAFNKTLDECLQALGFTATGNRVWSSADEKSWRHFLTEDRLNLEAMGFNFLFGHQFRFPFVTSRDWSAMIAASGENHFELSASVNVGGHIVHLLDLLARVREADSTADQVKVALQNGLILLLPKTVSELLEEIADLVSDDSVRLHKNQLARLSSIGELLPENTQWHDQAGLLDQARQLCSSPLVQQKDIPGLRAELRPYQWLGVCWLQHLTARGVNGLLADDMGLGKTLQTIAHLCIEREQGRLQQPALIVVPTSLLHNWQQELQRFAPDLKCLVLHGSDRSGHWPRLENYQVLISSYGLVVRDLEMWRQQKLSWLILDEAQVIKNRQTQVRRAVMEIPAKHRLCLSGTPVENHLGELWSIFDFLLPGCLGDYSHFRHHYRKPIEEQADTRSLEKLLGHIAPFMLRRTKRQIARDLPPKTVIHQTIDMEEDQREFYQSLKKQSVEEIEQQLAGAQGAGTQQIILLAALTRLRQACCDPALLDADNITSAKRRHCIDMIRELVDEGRSLLVFSQFTRMLDLLAGDLANDGINFQLLTGETKNRREQVEAFQNGEAPVFLISLKAGGVGLNLTRADTVIHFDPWWNSAAEEQASDRAHRIGQDKPVFVYKLIMENTIEEKIVKMQERKFALGAHVNQQAELSGRQFSLKLEDLLLLWQSETESEPAND